MRYMGDCHRRSFVDAIIDLPHPEPVEGRNDIDAACRSCTLENRGDALPAADALRGERIALAFALQQRGSLAGDARAGSAERMAERDGAAIEVGLGLIDAELSHAGERLR